MDPEPFVPDLDTEAQACAICFQNLSFSDERCPLSCGHGQWHGACVQRWLLKRNTCPVCRAPQHAAVDGIECSPSTEEEDSDEEGIVDDIATLHGIVSSLVGPVQSWQPQLQDVRLALEQRVAELDAEHQRLEEEMRSLESGLDVDAMQPVRPHGEQVIEHDHSASARESLERDALGAGELCMVLDAVAAGQSVLASHPAPAAPSRSPNKSTASDLLVTTLLSRLRGAVLRASSPASIFHALASTGGQIFPGDLAPVLCGFEANITPAEVASVFSKLDTTNRGFLDEAAWTYALEIHDAVDNVSLAAVRASQQLLDEAAWELLRRIAAALQRQGQSPEGLFQALGEHGQDHLTPAALQHLFGSFDAPESVVLQAIELLDVKGQGRVEESAFQEIFGSLMCASWTDGQDILPTV